MKLLGMRVMVGKNQRRNLKAMMMMVKKGQEKMMKVTGPRMKAQLLRKKIRIRLMMEMMLC